MLVYVPSPRQIDLRTLVWVNREGKETPVAAEPRPYGPMHLSPDGRQVAIQVDAPGNPDIWIYDLMRGLRTRFTFDLSFDSWPIWTPDGKRVVFGSGRGGGALNLFSKAADGTGPVERLNLTTSDRIQSPYSIAPDGKTLVFAEAYPGTGIDIGVVTMDGEHQIEMLLQTEFTDTHPNVSPDGRWLAYTIDESGRREVHVRPFPNVDDGRWQISRGLGVSPLWGPDSRELFYQTRAAPGAPVTMMVAVNDTEPTFRPGNPVPLFEGPYRFSVGASYHTFDISPDGERFLMIKEDTDPSSAEAQIIVVENWFEELKRLVPVD